MLDLACQASHMYIGIFCFAHIRTFLLIFLEFMNVIYLYTWLPPKWVKSNAERFCINNGQLVCLRMTPWVVHASHLVQSMQASYHGSGLKSAIEKENRPLKKKLANKEEKLSIKEKESPIK